MDQAQQNLLADLLAQRYSQAEREVLLERLGVNPEECTLGSQQPDEVAWRMVRWFEDRGRLEELARAAQVGWTRRLVRRLSLGGVALGVVLFGVGVGVDLFGVQGRLCRLPVRQPALADACGAWALGGAPTRAERLAWSGRERGSCAALRAHLLQFPRGAYRREAEAHLQARRVDRVPTWTPREHPLEMFVGHDQEAPQRDRAAALRAVQDRAQGEATRLCKNFAATGQNRLREAYVKEPRSTCVRIGGGYSCNLAGMAYCRLEEQGQEEHEQCPEGDRP